MGWFDVDERQRNQQKSDDDAHRDEKSVADAHCVIQRQPPERETRRP